MSAKRTPWFPAGVRPVHEGEYEVHRECVRAGYPKRTRLLWSKGEWLHTQHSCPGYAGTWAYMDWMTDKWRGLL